MSGNTPIAITSQFVQAEFDPASTPTEWAASVNEALELIVDDLQRLAGRTESSLPVASGTYRMVMPANGQARVYAICDTATSGSDAFNYVALQLSRNGTLPLTLTYDSRRTEVFAYMGGIYLGEMPVSTGDVVAVAININGAPSPVLTTDNFSLLVFLKET